MAGSRIGGEFNHQGTQVIPEGELVMGNKTGMLKGLEYPVNGRGVQIESIGDIGNPAGPIAESDKDIRCAADGPDLRGSS